MAELNKKDVQNNKEEVPFAHAIMGLQTSKSTKTTVIPERISTVRAFRKCLRILKPGASIWSL